MTEKTQFIIISKLFQKLIAAHEDFNMFIVA